MTFDEVFDRTVGYEGGYINDPLDPGGETKWGISKREYPRLIISELTRDDAKTIYKRDFWNNLDLDDHFDAVKYQVFDYAVNSGMGTAIRSLQKAINVAADGNWGPVSDLALRNTNEPDVILRLNAERLEYMTGLKNWSHDGKGWARRIANNLRYGSGDQ